MGAPSPARLDSALSLEINPAVQQSPTFGVLGLILLAMIILPWLFRKLFL